MNQQFRKVPSVSIALRCKTKTKINISNTQISTFHFDNTSFYFSNPRNSTHYAWERLTEELAGLVNSIARPPRAQRKLEQLVPEIRRQRERFLAYESRNEILRHWNIITTTTTTGVSRRRRRASHVSSSPSQSIALVWVSYDEDQQQCQRISLSLGSKSGERKIWRFKTDNEMLRHEGFREDALFIYFILFCNLLFNVETFFYFHSFVFIWRRF